MLSQLFATGDKKAKTLQVYDTDRTISFSGISLQHTREMYKHASPSIAVLPILQFAPHITSHALVRASALATSFAGLGKRTTGCGFLQLVGHVRAYRFEHNVGLLDLLFDVPFQLLLALVGRLNTVVGQL